MSQENVEMVRAAMEALNRHDLDEMFELSSPECEIDVSRAQWGPIRGIHSIEQWRALQEEIIGMWESARWEVSEYIDLGEHVVAPMTGRFRGRDGVEVQAEMTWVYTFRDGAMRRATLFQQREEALEAAGA